MERAEHGSSLSWDKLDTSEEEEEGLGSQGLGVKEWMAGKED